MAIPKNDLNQLKLAIAYLAASVVQTLNESDPSFQTRFSETLSKAYGTLRDQGGDRSGSGIACVDKGNPQKGNQLGLLLSCARCMACDPRLLRLMDGLLDRHIGERPRASRIVRALGLDLSILKLTAAKFKVQGTGRVGDSLFATMGHLSPHR